MIFVLRETISITTCWLVGWAKSNSNSNSVSKFDGICNTIHTIVFVYSLSPDDGRWDILNILFGLHTKLKFLTILRKHSRNF